MPSELEELEDVTVQVAVLVPEERYVPDAIFELEAPKANVELMLVFGTNETVKLPLCAAKLMFTPI